MGWKCVEWRCGVEVSGSGVKMWCGGVWEGGVCWVCVLAAYEVGRCAVGVGVCMVGAGGV